VADEGDELALLHAQVDVGQRGELALLGVEHHLGVFDVQVVVHGVSVRVEG
jgi:hypothetical protein